VRLVILDNVDHFFSASSHEVLKVQIFVAVRQLLNRYPNLIVVGTTNSAASIDTYARRMLFTTQFTLTTPTSQQRHSFISGFCRGHRVPFRDDSDFFQYLTEVTRGSTLADLMAVLPVVVGKVKSLDEDENLQLAIISELMKSFPSVLGRHDFLGERIALTHDMVSNKSSLTSSPVALSQIIPPAWTATTSDPRRYTNLSSPLPFTYLPSLFGVLLHGPPGGGKTHLARSILQSVHSTSYSHVKQPHICLDTNTSIFSLSLSRSWFDRIWVKVNVCFPPSFKKRERTVLVWCSLMNWMLFSRKRPFKTRSPQRRPLSLNS
jgi:hypothetical protein